MTDRHFLRVRLDAILTAPVDVGAADRLAQWLQEASGAESVEVGAPPAATQLHLSPVLVVDRDADVGLVADQLAARLLAADGVQAVTIDPMAGVAPAYQRRCRVGGELFYARKPTTDICRGHWYSEQVGDAEDRYRPLIDAIAAATGLSSYVWQSGGMTMTLVTPFQADNQEPYEGDRYLTLVEGWHDDGGLEGSTGFYATTDEEGSEGATVVLAYQDEWFASGAMPSYAASAAVFRTTITAGQWAAAIADHYREFLRTTREGGQAR
jgi:hypothetical protein